MTLRAVPRPAARRPADVRISLRKNAVLAGYPAAMKRATLLVLRFGR